MTTTFTTTRTRVLHRNAVSRGLDEPDTRRRWTLWLGPFLILAALAVSTGCTRLVASSMGDALAEDSLVYAGDDDVELVGAAIPFGLKTIETLLVQVPQHRGLLTAAARGFTQYA